ncbi:MAG: dockerin type I repeat-containing protein [candidate division Zixibacteria bacterium]|nr:dockerin type I repeat-containing protein [candidate division Zixibacteria bacterium]MDH3937021.1 dockerin type I repeat-containing protein [candidate division Zixibacteria bacterium]MDH4032167.1 dockerin type I repeat-containing protein [candidate division Zixibacteria bacterium]
MKTIILMTAMATLLCSVVAFAYPPAGYDVVNTSANISIYDPLDPNVLLEVVSMDGRAVIYRGDPYDAGGGVMTIDTRMDTLLLRGFSLNFGDSVFAVLDRSGPLSTGQIWQLTAGTDFPAESFFDVYYKLHFGSEPANPSPGDGPDDDATRHGSFNYDLKSQSGSIVSGKAAPLTNKLPAPRPAQETSDKGARQGGEDIGSAVFLPTIPTVTVGTTCGYTNDYDEVCPYTGSTAPDVVYVIDPPLDTFITLSTCFPGGFDTKLYVYENTYTPGAPYACNDDACPDYTSIISCMPVLANATYYIVVDGYGADCGDYELSVEYAENCVPCVIDCDAAAYQEAEPCGNDDNGGCNSTPNQFEPIQCGMDVCGTAWADGGSRDTDWYSFTLASTMTIELTGSAEFPYVLGFVDTSDCALAASVDPVAVGLACDTQTVSRVAGPGTYYVFMAVNDYNNYPCADNNDYFFQLRCFGGDPTPEDPPHMIDTIWQIPPHGRVYVDPRKTPLIDPATGDTIAWVWHEHIVDPPDPGEDTVPTIGIMNYWVGPNPPGGTQPPDETVELVGEAIINRGPVEQGENGHTIQTEILSMDLTGESSLLGPMILSLPFPAPGLVTGVDTGGPYFPAESFFDVYYQVELPAQGQTIEPIQPPRMQTQVEALPPVDNQYNDLGGEPHPIHDIQNPGVPIGWVLPIHWVQPPPDPPDPTPDPDTIPTIGIMPVIIGPAQPAPDQKPDETIHLSGDVILQRGVGYDDPPSGQHIVEVEILQMDLTGESSLFGPTILSLPFPAPGQITTQIGDPLFPAESFFDVYYEVELPDQGQTIAPDGDPPHMHAQINEVPPNNVQYETDGWQPVYEIQNPGVIIGWVWPIHWVQPPPPPPPDPIPTIGIMPVIVGPDPPAVGQTPDETIFLGGDAVIQRGSPYTNNQGQTEIQTEMVQMDLTGESSLFGGVILSLPQAAPGLITSVNPGSDFPAESFFDVYYEVELPDQGQVIQPEDPVRMQTEINEIPPTDNQYQPDDWHPIVDVQGTGGIIGWIQPVHWVQPPPTGACCDTNTGFCAITTQTDCEASNREYQGDLTTCVPNPCEQPCTGWLPGISNVAYTSFQVDIYDPNNNTILLGTAYAFGVGMVVQRNAPYEVSPGIWRMDTDILAFSGSGNSPLLGGAFSIDLDPNETSTGYIQMCDSCNDFWAESHFDIKYRILTSLPFPNNFYYGNALMDLNCDQQWNPYSGGTGDFDPPNGHTYVDPRKVPILNENGEVIGYTMKRHQVDREPMGACCEAQTELCFIMTQADCEASGGTYQGDNVGCDPNPCDTCETGWLPGQDIIPLHDFQIDLFDPTGVLITTLHATGNNMVVQRNAPYQESPGIFRMDTDILQLDGSGDDPVLLGPFVIQLDPSQPSGGWIRMCDSCNDNWAESFFDVHWVITTSMPWPMDVLHGLPAQMHLNCGHQWNPFPGGVFRPPYDLPYDDPRLVEIFDNNGQLIGFTMKLHTPRPDDGCCQPPERMRGDINCDGVPGMDISDLVYLVDYMFTGGPEPCCFEDADVNCDGSIDISDLVYVVDYMFTGGPQPCRCDCLDCLRGQTPSEVGLETLRKWSSHTTPRSVPPSCRTGAAR